MSSLEKILSSMAAVLHLLMAIKLLAGIAVITVHGAGEIDEVRVNNCCIHLRGKSRSKFDFGNGFFIKIRF